MFKISESVIAALARQSEQDYELKLTRWVQGQPELAELADRAAPAWSGQTLRIARGVGIESEDDVARFARLRLLRGDDWLDTPPARDILDSGRTGQLKAFQLECLHWGVSHG